MPHLPPVPGGATRQDSVRAGLEALEALAPDIVLVHDAARPLIPAGTIPALLAALQHAPGAIPAAPVADTLKRVVRGTITATVPRDGLYRAQTPQAFRFQVLLAAHRSRPGAAATDDASLLEAIGEPVAIVPGSDDNIKLTYAEDLARLERAMIGHLIPRVGTGFDVHVLETGRTLMLCGVAVPHDKGLAGHSDADVGIHALCDAIYGALAEGDIGRHFPPSEAAWKDADSARFLAHAAGRIAARGGRLANADVTLICERPKIAPHAAAMSARLAAILGVDASSHLGKGDDDREARLHRSRRGHRRPGCRHRPAARLRRADRMKHLIVAAGLLLGGVRRQWPTGARAAADGRGNPQASGQPGAADLAAGTLGLDRQLLCLDAGPDTSIWPVAAAPGCLPSGTMRAQAGSGSRDTGCSGARLHLRHPGHGVSARPRLQRLIDVVDLRDRRWNHCRNLRHPA